MFDLMALGQGHGPAPLYVHTAQRVLREMRILQQSTGSRFDYGGFKQRVLNSDLLSTQLEPLKQRLDALESFMPLQQADSRWGGMAASNSTGSSWTPKVTYKQVQHQEPSANELTAVAADNHRPLVPLHFAGYSLLTLQRLLWNFHGAGHRNRQSSGAG